jgi:hypothetical protein
MTVPAGMVWVSKEDIDGPWTNIEVGDKSALAAKYPGSFKLVPQVYVNALQSAINFLTTASAEIDSYQAPPNSGS